MQTSTSSLSEGGFFFYRRFMRESEVGGFKALYLSRMLGVVFSPAARPVAFTFAAVCFRSALIMS